MNHRNKHLNGHLNRANKYFHLKICYLRTYLIVKNTHDIYFGQDYIDVMEL